MFEEGNQHWRLRKVDGKPKKMTPDELLDACNGYFQFIESNPFQEEQIINRTSKIESADGRTIELPYTKATVSKMRPFTIEGLCNHIGIVKQTLLNWEKESDYLDVITRVRQIIYNQKFEGAASGFLNPNIIARDLGLSDKKEIEVTDITVSLPDED